MMEIAFAATREQLEQTRSLMRSFVAWQRQRNSEDLPLIDEYFDSRAYEAELASLPGQYAPPQGRLLLACQEGQAVGCVALRALDARACEMKRMFVREPFQGTGVGRALGEAVIREARSIGYQSVLLDTSFRQIEAQRLYERLGFRRVEPYYELPAKVRDWLVFMELKLQS